MADFTKVIRSTSHVPTLRAIMIKNLNRINLLKKIPILGPPGQQSMNLARRRYNACKYRMRYLRGAN